ncbi:50S ribosomal protein L32 [Mycoplasma todarodis]|uniref:Large ribosomal subunit protein bL32 n=1 Tax=Mycoplasma todarodis TaxID=1937191 RepID=A0A4R0XIT1_9MOLU|nr:50S ribosomal protein L32 [Mycoplasma todarodis]TCG10493.1 50S ribosomal protein L32 [Mycoplasma todarodis]
MAIVPKRKTSKQRKRNCGEKIQQHRACKFCGFYKDRQVIEGINDK